MDLTIRIAHLSDLQLAAEVARLAQQEWSASADLVACLAEFDRRRIYLAQGFTSIYAYCRERLHLADGAAYRRIETHAPSLIPPQSRRPVVAPLSEAHYKLQVTISASAHDRLRNIQDLMRHANPSGDPAAIVERALELLHADLLKRKAAEVSRPRATRDGGDSTGRHIPAAVTRAVWRRDDARCAFVGEGGRTCGSTSGLEFHHVQPFAVGGAATVDNIELRCRAHNAFEWEQHVQETCGAATHG